MNQVKIVAESIDEHELPMKALAATTRTGNSIQNRTSYIERINRKLGKV